MRQALEGDRLFPPHCPVYSAGWRVREVISEGLGGVGGEGGGSAVGQRRGETAQFTVWLYPLSSE